MQAGKDGSPGARRQFQEKRAEAAGNKIFFRGVLNHKAEANFVHGPIFLHNGYIQVVDHGPLVEEHDRTTRGRRVLHPQAGPDGTSAIPESGLAYGHPLVAFQGGPPGQFRIGVRQILHPGEKGLRPAQVREIKAGFIGLLSRNSRRKEQVEQTQGQKDPKRKSSSVIKIHYIQ